LSPAFQPRDHGLRRAHALRDLGLGQSSARARSDQFLREIEFIAQSLIGAAHLAIRQHFSLDGLQTLGHKPNSFKRLSAKFIALRGVFCVFFTNALFATLKK
jgi:hypothetical protein